MQPRNSETCKYNAGHLYSWIGQVALLHRFHLADPGRQKVNPDRTINSKPDLTSTVDSDISETASGSSTQRRSYWSSH
ncbi:uncharacterized protein J3R85_014669 [Psidium guajava]|nr:uncharacterized protein J3R85_014669 [Psidium guajava]